MLRLVKGRRYFGTVAAVACLGIVGCGAGRVLTGTGGFGGSGAAAGAGGKPAAAGTAGTLAAAGAGGIGGAGGSAGAGGIGGAGGSAAAGGIGGAGGGRAAGGGAGSPIDASPDGPRPFCPKSIAEYCVAAGWLCAPTWADVLADSSYCDRRGYRDWRGACGITTFGSSRAAATFSCTITTTWRPASWWRSSWTESRVCLAGPPDFVPPACNGGVMNPVCPDGGVVDATTD